MKSIVQYLWNVADRLPIDNKLIAAGTTYLLTKLLVSQGIDIGGNLIPGYLSWAQVIALAASGAAGWYTANEATHLRKPPLPGNPVLPEGFDDPVPDPVKPAPKKPAAKRKPAAKKKPASRKRK